MKSYFNFIFITLSITFQAIGAVFGKYAALNGYGFSSLALLTNLFFILALMSMLLQAIIWQQVLIHYPLSFAYPCMSLANFIILLLSAHFFNEGITTGNLFGLGIITIGIVLLFHNVRGKL